MAIDNSTEKNIPKAAAGDLFTTVEGETLWTSFTLSGDYVWTLGMGVVGDAARTSTVVAPTPFMGLLEKSITKSWAESAYDHVHVNGCWELYGVDTPHAFPSTGSDMGWTTIANAPGAIAWATNWTNIEVPTCAGAPTATFSEAHSPVAQIVNWTIVGGGRSDS